MWSTCSLLARAGITCYSFHASCITADRIGLTAVAVQECAQPYLHSGHAPYYIGYSNMARTTLPNTAKNIMFVTTHLHCKLVDPVSGKDGMRVPVDEAGDDRLAGAVNHPVEGAGVVRVAGGDLGKRAHVLDEAETLKNKRSMSLSKHS
jgi:hypothetical protein